MRGLALDNGWTARHYRWFRLAFGIYLAVHFAQLLPWTAELFSDAGVLPEAAHSPLFRLLPSPFWWDAGPTMAAIMVLGGLLSSVAFALGWWDRWAAIGVWYVWACLHARMPLIANPSLPFVGFMLLLHAALPTTPPSLWRTQASPGNPVEFRFEPPLFAVLWIVMALGYSYSGYTKLVSPSWVDGSALSHVLQNPLARPTGLRTLLLSLPEAMLRTMTWSALAAELLFAPLAIFKRLRPLLWTMMVSMHIGLLVLIDFADLTLAMLLLHALSFDPAWLGSYAIGQHPRQPALTRQ